MEKASQHVCRSWAAAVSTRTRLAPLGGLWLTHRPLSSSFLGLPSRIVNIKQKRELLRRLWVIIGCCRGFSSILVRFCLRRPMFPGLIKPTQPPPPKPLDPHRHRFGSRAKPLRGWLVCERFRPSHPLAPERHTLEGVEPLLQLGGIALAENPTFPGFFISKGFLINLVR